MMMINKFTMGFLAVSLLSVTAFSGPGNAVTMGNDSDSVTVRVHYQVARHVPGEDSQQLISSKVFLDPKTQQNVVLSDFHREWLTNPAAPPEAQYRVTVLAFPEDKEYPGTYVESLFMSLAEALAHYTSGTVQIGTDVTPNNDSKTCSIKL